MHGPAKTTPREDLVPCSAATVHRDDAARNGDEDRRHPQVAVGAGSTSALDALLGLCESACRSRRFFYGDSADPSPEYAEAFAVLARESPQHLQRLIRTYRPRLRRAGPSPATAGTVVA